MIPQMYIPPPRGARSAAESVGARLSPRPAERKDQIAELERFEDFFSEVAEELSKFGEIRSINVCGNTCTHLAGNVYVTYYSERDAQACIIGVANRTFAGRPLVAEFSPVSDFLEARCRQYETSQCNRGGTCNFMHVLHPPRFLQHELDDLARKARHERRALRERERREERERRRGNKKAKKKRKKRERAEGERPGASSSSSNGSSSDSALSDGESRRRKRSRRDDARALRSNSAERRAKFAELNARRRQQQ